jgi:hypothetical protein
MPSIRLVPLLVCGLWPTLGLAQNVLEIDRAVASVVHVCLADGRTEAVIGGPTDAFELSLRSIDSEGNIRAELNISASNADRFQARVANAIARLTSDKAAKVGACLEPVYARLKEVASSSAPIRNRGSPPLALGGAASGCAVLGGVAAGCAVLGGAVATLGPFVGCRHAGEGL